MEDIRREEYTICIQLTIDRTIYRNFQLILQEKCNMEFLLSSSTFQSFQYFWCDKFYSIQNQLPWYQNLHLLFHTRNSLALNLCEQFLVHDNSWSIEGSTWRFSLRNFHQRIPSQQSCRTIHLQNTSLLLSKHFSCLQNIRKAWWCVDDRGFTKFWLLFGTFPNSLSSFLKWFYMLSHVHWQYVLPYWLCRKFQNQVRPYPLSKHLR